MDRIQLWLQEPLAPIILVAGLVTLVAFALIVIALIAHFNRRESALNNQLDRVQQQMAEQLNSLEQQTWLQGQKDREELSGSIRSIGDSVTKAMGEMARTQQSQLDSFAGQLQDINRTDERRMDGMQRTIEQRLLQYQDRMDRVGDVLDDKLTLNDQRIDQLRQSLEIRMQGLQQDNSRRLQQIEHTVDERLNETLDRRLNESFMLVNDRLERVYQGLGEMQTIASGMGDLKRVLTNVRTKGLVGEIQLEALLSQLMTPEQYQSGVRVRPGGDDVDFAIVLPARGRDERSSLLPIDAGFPNELYGQLLDALDSADAQRAEQLELQLKDAAERHATRIQEQFISPPQTTDFAVLFLGSEGLYAELLRQDGLFERLQRDRHVMLAGPTTLSALLNSLQMGMKTIAIERRSEEVWSLLGAVRGEIGNFAEALARTQKRIRQAGESIEDAAQKSRIIQRKLKHVELPESSERKRLLQVNDMDEDLYEGGDWD